MNLSKLCYKKEVAMENQIDVFHHRNTVNRISLILHLKQKEKIKSIDNKGMKRTFLYDLFTSIYSLRFIHFDLFIIYLFVCLFHYQVSHMFKIHSVTKRDKL